MASHTQDYYPLGRDDAHSGVINLPGGEEFYRNTLKYYTYDEMTPEIAHDYGVNQTNYYVSKIREVRL